MNIMRCEDSIMHYYLMHDTYACLPKGWSEIAFFVLIYGTFHYDQPKGIFNTVHQNISKCSDCVVQTLFALHGNASNFR